MAKKSNEQRAAERAEVLENLSEEKKKSYRERKTYVGVAHSWRDYFVEMDGEDIKELILAIIDYDVTGEMPELSKGANKAIFKGFIKSFIDRLFDEWCYSCYRKGGSGSDGGKETAIRKITVKELTAHFRTTDLRGVPYEDLLRNDTEAWSNLQKITGDHFEEYKKIVWETYGNCKKEYLEELEKE